MKFVNAQRIITGLATAGILAISGTSYAAGTAAFSLTGASATNGSNATVAIYENGTSINAVTATFAYDSSKLQFVSDSCAGTFSSTVASSSSSITCFVPGGNAAVSGSSEVATVSFKAVATGSASVTVTGSQIASSGTNEWNGGQASTAIAIAAPSTPSQPTGGSSSTNGGTTKSTGSKTVTNGSGKSSTSQNTKPSTTDNSTTTSNDSKGKVMGTSTSNKSDKNKGKVANLSNGKSHRVSYVTSSISIILILVAAAYWFFFMKRTETAPAKVYKLDSASKAKAATKTSKAKTTKSKSTRGKK